jgi:hypothetical protein
VVGRQPPQDRVAVVGAEQQRAACRVDQQRAQLGLLGSRCTSPLSWPMCHTRSVVLTMLTLRRAPCRVAMRTPPRT